MFIFYKNIDKYHKYWMRTRKKKLQKFIKLTIIHVLKFSFFKKKNIIKFVRLDDHMQ